MFECGNFSRFFEFLFEKLHSEHCIKNWILNILAQDLLKMSKFGVKNCSLLKFRML